MICIGCGGGPELYAQFAEEAGVTAEEYVRNEEGTYNPTNGHFLCDPCYVAAGMPSAPGGWKAP